MLLCYPKSGTVGVVYVRDKFTNTYQIIYHTGRYILTYMETNMEKTVKSLENFQNLPVFLAKNSFRKPSKFGGEGRGSDLILEI